MSTLPELSGTGIEVLEQTLLTTIPLARAMQLRVTQYQGDTLQISAPLAPNSNDKGCAFGGSLASAMTLAGWGLPWLWLREAGRLADIYVQDSQVRYLAPLWGDLACSAHSEQRELFLSTFESKGKARLSVEVETRDADGVLVASLSARFVALPQRVAEA